MRGRKRRDMKYFPQVAISWETAAAFSLLCICLGAAFCAALIVIGLLVARALAARAAR